MEVDFSKIFGSFTETSGNNTTPLEKQYTSDERSERSERSDSAVRKHILQDFWGDSRKPPKRTRHHKKNVTRAARHSSLNALPVHLPRQVFSIPNAPKTILCWTSSWEASWRPLRAILGGFLEAKMAPRPPKMPTKKAKRGSRKAKM